ncbi:MAG: site-specific DNA-methyltransferase [Desulfobacterales bacterium]
MRTEHRVFFRDAADLSPLPAASVELVLTSPPYPMIAMWDDSFRRGRRAIAAALEAGDGWAAFRLMHETLDRTWRETHRVLRPGGFACIVIGDAVRTVKGRFGLFPNHVRILQALLEIGFTPLPPILWRKQTNAPTKFMGSGMYPAGAYVTLEHEHILIVRKGGPREFSSAEEKRRRRESALFWEERNRWYSDVWMDLKGTRQERSGVRGRPRSGAYPFELAFRLVCMYSIRGDTVLDPFLGTGTTLRAAAAAGRHGIGFEIDPALRGEILSDPALWLGEGRRRVAARFAEHLAFIEERRAAGGAFRHAHRRYGYPVMTRQERDLELFLPEEGRCTGKETFAVSYRPMAPTVQEPPAEKRRISPATAARQERLRKAEARERGRQWG